MRAAVIAVCSAGALAFLAGCGGSSAPPLAAGDASQLRRDVRAIRTAAGAGQPAGAHRALAALRGDVEQMIKSGRLSAVDGRLLLLEAGQVDGRILVQAHPVVSTPSPAPRGTATPATTNATRPATTSVPVAKPKPSGRQSGKGNGDGHGKGHGQGGGTGGD